MREEMLTWNALVKASGHGVKVAVIDSGVEVGHPEFVNCRFRCFKTVACWDSFHRTVVDKSGEDAFGHGTAVASIISRYAPGARLDSIRVLDGSLRSTSSRVVAAIQWAVESGYDVINCSFGAGGNAYLLKYKEVVDEVFRRGAVLIAACNNEDYRVPEYPGAFPVVIAVDHGDFEGLKFSRRTGELVEFRAAGRGLRLPWKGGSYRSGLVGSSFAAPHMSALCARIRELRPSWNMLQVKNALYDLSEQSP